MDNTLNRLGVGILSQHVILCNFNAEPGIRISLWKLVDHHQFSAFPRGNAEYRLS